MPIFGFHRTSNNLFATVFAVDKVITVVPDFEGGGLSSSGRGANMIGSLVPRWYGDFRALQQSLFLSSSLSQRVEGGFRADRWRLV